MFIWILGDLNEGPVTSTTKNDEGDEKRLMKAGNGRQKP